MNPPALWTDTCTGRGLAPQITASPGGFSTLGMGLTRLQRDCLFTLMANPGLSFEKMAARLGLSAKSQIFYLVRALEERGYVRRIRRPGWHTRTTAIEILAQPPIHISGDRYRFIRKSRAGEGE